MSDDHMEITLPGSTSFWKLCGSVLLGGLGLIVLPHLVLNEIRRQQMITKYRRGRPPPFKQKRKVSNSSSASIWDPPKKGPSMIRPSRSMDNLTQNATRPRSRIEMNDYEDADVPLRPFRILSIDGGGVRGVIAIRLLQRIMERHPDLLDETDLICGTSTGGLITFCIAAGATPTEMLELYRWNAPLIFSSSALRRFNPFNAKYSDDMKKEVLDYYLGDMKMKHLDRNVVVTSFRLDGGTENSGRSTFFPSGSWRPSLFSNVPLAKGVVPPDSELKISDAAMRTTAAPTFFAVYQHCVDGGLFAQNPALAGISKAYAHFPLAEFDRNVVVLSLGCGMKAHSVEGSPDWGLRQWAPQLLHLLMEAGSLSTELTLQMLLGKKYGRLDVDLETGDNVEYPLDDVSKLEELVALADDVSLDNIDAFIISEYMRETC